MSLPEKRLFVFATRAGLFRGYHASFCFPLMSCTPLRRKMLTLSLKAVFDKFDRSHAGLITGRDLRMFLGKELNDEDIDHMLKEAGLQHGGR